MIEALLNVIIGIAICKFDSPFDYINDFEEGLEDQGKRYDLVRSIFINDAASSILCFAAN